MNLIISSYFSLLIIEQLRQVIEAVVGYHFFRYEFTVLMYGIFPLYLLYCVYTHKVKISSDLYFLVILMLYPLLTALFIYPVNYSISYIYSDTIPPFIFFFAFAFAVDPREFKKFIDKKIVIIYYWVSCWSVLCAYFFDISYLSLIIVQFLFPVICIQNVKSNKFGILSFLVIYFSGKRSLLLSLPFIFNLRLKYIVVFSLIFLTVLYFGFVPEKYTNFYNCLLYDGVQQARCNDPRMQQILVVSQTIKELPITALIFGIGAGFYYNVLDSSRNIDISHNVHFSPLGLISTYGIIYAAAVYGYIARIVFKFKIKTSADRIFYYYSCFGLIYSLFAYSLFIDFMFVISLLYLKNTTSSANFFK